MTTHKTPSFWRKCGIPFRLVYATFENYETPTSLHEAAVSEMRAFCADRTLFALLSKSSGVGKSHLATAALKTFPCGVFITPRQLSNLYNGLPFDGAVTRTGMIEAIQRAPILVLDEIEASTGSPGELANIDEILGYRHDCYKKTILCSNLNPKAVAVVLGDRISDRVKESCMVITLPHESRRYPGSSEPASRIIETGFTGKLPEFPGCNNPPGWMEWLKVAHPDKRAIWGDAQFAPYDVRKSFEKGTEYNPNNETAK